MNFTTKWDQCKMQNVRVSISSNRRDFLSGRDCGFNSLALAGDLLSSIAHPGAGSNAGSTNFDTNLIYFNGDF